MLTRKLTNASLLLLACCLAGRSLGAAGARASSVAVSAADTRADTDTDADAPAEAGGPQTPLRQDAPAVPPAPGRRPRARPQAAAPPRRPAPAPAPALARPHHEEPADECDQDVDEPNYAPDHLFRSLAGPPMRQLSRFMDDMFDQMHRLGSAELADTHAWPRPNGAKPATNDHQQAYEYAAGPGGAASAAAGAFSSADGYSRTSSFVNSNGRARGVVSVTRNGRTSTRRYGLADDDEPADGAGHDW